MSFPRYARPDRLTPTYASPTHNSEEPAMRRQKQPETVNGRRPRPKTLHCRFTDVRRRPTALDGSRRVTQSRRCW